MSNTRTPADRRSAFRRILRMGLAALLIALASYAIFKKAPESATKQYSELAGDLQAKRVRALTFTPKHRQEGFTAQVELVEGASYETNVPALTLEAARDLAAQGIRVDFQDEKTGFAQAFSLLVSLLTVAVMLMIFLTMFRGASAGATRTGGKSRTWWRRLGHQLFGQTQQDEAAVRFADVAGAEEAKHALQDVVAYLREPDQFESLGARFPKGVVMYGEPGVGKTLLARAVAGESGANFIAVSGSDFVAMFVGMSAGRIRKVFEEARRSAPCVLFIDEIDAIGGKRLSEGSSVAREMGSTLNQLLVEMDGFQSAKGVVVIAATNRIEALDPALVRSGRFDRRIYLPAPNREERQAILRIHGAKIRLEDGFDFNALARLTTGMSGADLSNLMNQAAILATKRQATSIATADAVAARDLLVMGATRPGMVNLFDAQTRRLLAAHEAGHAVIAMLHGHDPVSRVSIVPRGMALGQTMMMPAQDRFVHDGNHLRNQLLILLGGRAAEQLVLQVNTTGARDDLARATALARDMICVHGMGDNGSLRVVDDASSQQRLYEADLEVDQMLRSSMRQAMRTLTEHRPLLDALIERLLADEEIDEHGLQLLLNAHRSGDDRLDGLNLQVQPLTA